MSTVQVVLTMLHAGGKFGGGGYKVSGGLHGVGVSVVNALSEWLTVDVRRDGYAWTQSFARGEPTTELVAGEPTTERGTTVTFKPDADIFETTEVDFEVLETREREMAFLTRGLRLQLIDQRTEDRDRRVLRRERPRRLRAAHQQEPHADAQDADHVRARDRRRPGRGRDAVERQLPGVRPLVREQHQHARGRHAPDRLPLGAHAHGQRLRALDRPDQGEGRPALPGRRARGPRRDHLGQAPGSPVRGPDEDEARQLADARASSRRPRTPRSPSGSRSTRQRRARSSTRRSRPPAPGRRRARRAISCGARPRSRTRGCPAS